MPGLAEVHVDTALTDFSAALFQDLGGSVASQAFSQRNVAMQSGVFHVYTAADLHRAEAERRAPNTSAHRKDYGLSTSPYQCEVWALAYDVSEQERANADPVLDASMALRRWALNFRSSNTVTSGTASLTREKVSTSLALRLDGIPYPSTKADR